MSFYGSLKGLRVMERKGLATQPKRAFDFLGSLLKVCRQLIAVCMDEFCSQEKMGESSFSLPGYIA